MVLVDWRVTKCGVWEEGLGLAVGNSGSGSTVMDDLGPDRHPAPYPVHFLEGTFTFMKQDRTRRLLSWKGLRRDGGGS